ncbi:glycosyltransferase family 2 protein [Flavobacterium ranwuense]|uniref:Glycosyltransferase family 2 protein n=1 Tax=Flavobacterium ranwuense TaxID=2541725 RepID=A0ABY2DPH5_9FLAO|nr:glycosyltransferase family 2 protein [Flavobacterium ranwuense]TDE28049.1 glycosyltransferase family 2 protein [Flavobacterium ranwuense]
MENNKFISIILPVYNGEKYLADSIESCLNQTYRNLELIIVNDCSTDNTFDIANRYAAADDRIRIINNKENKKLPASLNIGHKECKGDFITWTSHDNLYELNALEVLLNEILKENTDIVYSDFVLIDGRGDKLREVQLPGIENIIFGNFIGTCFLYRKEVYQRNNGYNDFFFLVEDYDFWLRSVLHSSYSHVKKTLYYYRKHSESLTNQIITNDNENKLWKENINKMYVNFCKIIMVTDYDKVSELLSNNLTHQKIDLEWIINNHFEIQNFKMKLKQNQNFGKNVLIEKVFLEMIIKVMISDHNHKNNFLRLVFIVKKYASSLDKKNIKTLIKYSFFNFKY